jgi:hypothetical protein
MEVVVSQKKRAQLGKNTTAVQEPEDEDEEDDDNAVIIKTKRSGAGKGKTAKGKGKAAAPIEVVSDSEEEIVSSGNTEKDGEVGSDDEEEDEESVASVKTHSKKRKVIPPKVVPAKKAKTSKRKSRPSTGESPLNKRARGSAKSRASSKNAAKGIDLSGETFDEDSVVDPELVPAVKDQVGVFACGSRRFADGF